MGLKVIEGGKSEQTDNEIPEKALDAVHQFLSGSQKIKDLNTEDVLEFALIMRMNDGYVICGSKNDYSRFIALLEEMKASLLISNFSSGGELIK